MKNMFVNYLYYLSLLTVDLERLICAFSLTRSRLSYPDIDRDFPRCMNDVKSKSNLQRKMTITRECFSCDWFFFA